MYNNNIICTYVVQPSIVEHPVMMQSVYPGIVVSFSCIAEGFSMVTYKWFMVPTGADIGMEIVNEVNTTYTITYPTFKHNGTGYYCIASNNEGIATSMTSTLIGNDCSDIVVFKNCFCAYVCIARVYVFACVYPP